MNRLIMYLNFLGIFALAALCANQWSVNHQLVDRVQALDRQSKDQLVRIAAQETTLKENAADIADLHQRIALSETQLAETARSLKSVTAERDQLRQVRDQFVTAIKQRDQLLSQQARVLDAQVMTIHKLEEDRNQAVAKFNDLATKYNAMVSAKK